MYSFRYVPLIITDVFESASSFTFPPLDTFVSFFPFFTFASSGLKINVELFDKSAPVFPSTNP